jgi:hypothetical protein
MKDTADERLFHAQDAYSCATLLAFFVLIGQILSLLTTGTGPQGIPFGVRFVLTIVSSILLGYVLATRNRPQERAAWAVCAVLLAPFLLLIPWGAVRWRELGRPWEAFFGPQMAMLTMGLTVPRSFWLGTAAVIIFLIEGLGIYAYFALGGAPRHWVPVTEPAVTILYAAVGLAVVIARRQRRQLSLRHIRSEAEAATLTRLSSFLPELIDELSAQLEVLSTGLERIVTTDARPMERGRAAIARLRLLGAQLANLVGHSPALPTAPGQAADRPREARRAEPALPAPRHGRAVLTLNDRERDVYARDAYQSVRVVAVMMAAAMLVAVAAARQRSQLLQLLWSGHAVVVTICLGILQRTWARPSERRGIVLYLVLVAPLLVIFVYSQRQWASGSEAFEPLTATKLLVVLLPLVAPRHRWLSLAMVGLVAAEGFVIFYAYHFERLRDRVPMNEPWSLVVHLLIAAALLTMREQRRVASVRLLRADREAAAQARQAGVVLALLDQVSSPLQVLTLTTQTLLPAEPDPEERDALARALERLSSISRRVPQVDRRLYECLGLSADAELELRPRLDPEGRSS